MFTRKALISSFGRKAALATVAALALAAFEPSTVQAGTSAPAKGVSATSGTSDATDISARRRYYRGGGGAAAAAAFAGIVGTGLAIAATQDRGYYGGPAYYGGSPYELVRLLRSSAGLLRRWRLLRRRLRLSQFRRAALPRPPARRLVITSPEPDRRPLGGRRFFFVLSRLGSQALTRWPPVWIIVGDD